MLKPIPEERETAKDLKILKKKWNSNDDKTKVEIDPIPDNRKKCFEKKR